MFTAALALFLASAPSASAVELLFSYSGSEGTFEFEDSSMPPAQGTGTASLISPTGVEDGTPSNFGGDIAFFLSKDDGGLNTDKLSLFGPQIFSGPTNAPVFSPGVYVLFSNPGDTVVDGSLTISSVVSPAPEPGVWLLMLAGFGAAGLAVRRRRAAA